MIDVDALTSTERVVILHGLELLTGHLKLCIELAGDQATKDRCGDQLTVVRDMALRLGVG